MQTTPTIIPILIPADSAESWKLANLKEIYAHISEELPDTDLRKRPTFTIPRAIVGEDEVTYLEVVVVSRFTKNEHDFVVTATGDVIDMTKFAAILAEVIRAERARARDLLGGTA